jgi:hypothetical protein
VGIRPVLPANLASHQPSSRYQRSLQHPPLQTATPGSSGLKGCSALTTCLQVVSRSNTGIGGGGRRCGTELELELELVDIEVEDAVAFITIQL